MSTAKRASLQQKPKSGGSLRQTAGQPIRSGGTNLSRGRASRADSKITAAEPKPGDARSETASKAGSAKYDAILRGAIKVFARNGFFNSKVADVAREAGVADGTVYLYFKNKDDILVSIFNDHMREALARGRQRLARIHDPVEKLKSIVYGHLEVFAGDRDRAVVFQVELRSSSKFMEQFSTTGVTEYIHYISDIIREGQQQGSFRPELNSLLVAKMLFGALDEMVTNWVISKKRSNLVATGDSVVDVFLRGIGRAQ
jgi:TetR/AcrR family fatty acid metabolism transcriptional regulator